MIIDSLKFGPLTGENVNNVHQMCEKISRATVSNKNELVPLKFMPKAYQIAFWPDGSEKKRKREGFRKFITKMVFMGFKKQRNEEMPNTLGRRRYYLFLYEKCGCKDMQNLLGNE